MIRINGRAAVYGEMWYDEEPARDARIDIAIYRQRAKPVDACTRIEPFLSLVSDLTESEEAIYARFSRDCRYKIRRAESRDNLTMEFITEPEPRLAELCAFYDAFARLKAVDGSDEQWLKAACRARQLVLGVASRDGEALVWHAYLLAGRTAQLQYTASGFRNHDSSDMRALYGRANRWLNWRSMLRFRGMGMGRYDWGGLFVDNSTAERAGINHFKMSFGGREERSFNCTQPVTLRGRFYLPMREAWQRLRPAR